MSHLRIIQGGRSTAASASRPPLVVKLAALYEGALSAAARIRLLTERHSDARTRVRLSVQHAFCRAQANRLKVRLDALGAIYTSQLTAADTIASVTLLRALHWELAFTEVMAERSRAAAELARQQADLSSAWVCELNRTEEQDRARELRGFIMEMEGAS